MHGLIYLIGLIVVILAILSSSGYAKSGELHRDEILIPSGLTTALFRTSNGHR